MYVSLSGDAWECSLCLWYVYVLPYGFVCAVLKLFFDQCSDFSRRAVESSLECTTAERTTRTTVESGYKERRLCAQSAMFLKS